MTVAADGAANQLYKHITTGMAKADTYVSETLRDCYSVRIIKGLTY